MSRALSVRAVSSGVKGHKPSFLFKSELIIFSFHQGYAYLAMRSKLKFKKDSYENTLSKATMRENPEN